MNEASPFAAMSLRMPPQNARAEQALLGAMLANNKAWDRVADTLRPEHFADPAHAAVYAAIERRLNAGQVADVVTLRPEIEASGVMEDCPGGIGYLATLLSAMVGIINAGDYAREVTDCWARRQIIDTCEVAVNRAFAPEAGAGAPEIMEALDRAMLVISQGNAVGGRLRTSGEVANDTLEAFFAAVARRGALSGVTTGYHAIDRRTGGLNKGDLTVLGARPSMGKTALSAGIAARAAAAGHRVLFVSAEMRDVAVMARIVAAVSGLPVAAVLRGGMIPPGVNVFQPFDPDGAEAARIVTAAHRAKAMPLWWDQAEKPTVAAIRARARRQKRAGGLDLLVVDYLGRCCGSPATAGNRYAEVSEMARDFKSLARELEIPVLLLSQLSRATETRDDPRPRLSDLRDSGDIEQEADVVMFLHREEYYLERSKPTQREKEKSEDFEDRTRRWAERLAGARGWADLDVPKQRQGAVGSERLRFAGPLTWFFDEADPDGLAVPGLPE